MQRVGRGFVEQRLTLRHKVLTARHGALRKKNQALFGEKSSQPSYSNRENLLSGSGRLGVFLQRRKFGL